MRLNKASVAAALAGLLVAVGLPLAGHWARQRTEPLCTLDSVRIDPAYRIEVVDSEGRTHAFCCPLCAGTWLRRQPSPPRSITVTDEASGEPIDAAKAYYVRNAVETTPVSGNRIHVFRHQADAERNAREHAGVVLLPSENPFR